MKIEFQRRNLPPGVLCDFNVRLSSPDFNYLLDKVDTQVDLDLGPLHFNGILRMEKLPGHDNTVRFWMEEIS